VSGVRRLGAVIEPEAVRLLTRGDERAVRYDVVISPTETG
jgi:hypothetical protein